MNIRTPNVPLSLLDEQESTNLQRLDKAKCAVADNFAPK
jgi:hypothetical protein